MRTKSGREHGIQVRDGSKPADTTLGDEIHQGTRRCGLGRGVDRLLAAVNLVGTGVASEFREQRPHPSLRR